MDSLVNSVKDRECTLCFEEVSTKGVLTKCCTKIFCIDCAYQSAEFKKSDSKLVGKCPGCNKPIKLEDMIPISLDQEIDPSTVSSIKKEIKVKSHDISDSKQDKIDVLLDILAGKETKFSKTIRLNMPTLIHGMGSYIPTNQEDRKFVIVSSNKGNLLELYTELKGYKYDPVMFNEDYIITQKESIILLHTDHAVGINLQFMSDIILLHGVTSNEIEAQIIGRIQRFPRKTSANIHYILYNGENLKHVTE
jgi:hypothetical protein